MSDLKNNDAVSTEEDAYSFAFGALDRKSYIETLFRAALAVAVALAFLFSPMLRFASPTALFFAGLASTLGVIAAILAIPVAPAKRIRLVITACFLLVTVPLAALIIHALMRSEMLDSRCMVVEREMMRGEPRRDDLPDVFQALGCRPQLDYAPRRPAK